MSNWFDRRYNDAHWDHERDLRKHDFMTDDDVAAELDRIEREMLATAAKSRAACKEAMTVIENLMNDLGIPRAPDSKNEVA